MNREQDLAQMEAAMIARGRMAAPLAVIESSLAEADRRLQHLIAEELRCAPADLATFAVRTQAKLGRVMNEIAHIRTRIRDLEPSELATAAAREARPPADDAERGERAAAASAATANDGLSF